MLILFHISFSSIFNHCTSYLFPPYLTRYFSLHLPLILPPTMLGQIPHPKISILWLTLSPSPPTPILILTLPAGPITTSLSPYSIVISGLSSFSGIPNSSKFVQAPDAIFKSHAFKRNLIKASNMLWASSDLDPLTSDERKQAGFSTDLPNLLRSVVG